MTHAESLLTMDSITTRVIEYVIEAYSILIPTFFVEVYNSMLIGTQPPEYSDTRKVASSRWMQLVWNIGSCELETRHHLHIVQT
jgi:hypothetical protein